MTTSVSTEPSMQAGVRRSPRYTRFIWTGVLAGLLVAMVLPLVVGRAPGFSWFEVMRSVALLSLPMGALLGGASAALASRGRRPGSDESPATVQKDDQPRGGQESS